tara:strand:+ start:236 stop:1036 length:801 start_codon:yes stop_codon:yes gene_type:complete
MTSLFLNQLNEVLGRHSNAGLIGLKSEYESEGIRPSELSILTHLAKQNNLKTALKIGGTEAKSDLICAFDQLTDYIIVPMIETSYAAYKSVNMFRSLARVAQYKIPGFLINIETVTSLNNILSIIEQFDGLVDGIVFGRVDFTLSANLSRSQILDSFVSDSARKVSSICRDNDLEFVLGGGISVESIDFLKELSDIRLDRFETRKCILDPSSLFTPNITTILQDCVLAELLWLKSKSSSYQTLSIEDQSRIEMLEKRHLYNISTCA